MIRSICQQPTSVFFSIVSWRCGSCAGPIATGNPGRSMIERCFPQRRTVFARMVLLKLNQPGSNYRICRSGWWLGHPSEKYESQLG